MDIRKLVGRRIRELREAAGLSQDALALAAKVTRNHVGEIERGSRGISITTLEKIARALQVEPKTLLDFEASTTVSRDPLARRIGLLLEATPKRERELFGVIAEAFFRQVRARKPR